MVRRACFSAARSKHDTRRFGQRPGSWSRLCLLSTLSVLLLCVRVLLLPVCKAGTCCRRNLDVMGSAHAELPSELRWGILLLHVGRMRPDADLRLRTRPTMIGGGQVPVVVCEWLVRSGLARPKRSAAIGGSPMAGMNSGAEFRRRYRCCHGRWRSVRSGNS